MNIMTSWAAALLDDNSVLGQTARNRILGNTTIGAGQNSPSEDTIITTADVMLFTGAQINSGYSDVNGKLRFFLPSQENLTIAPGLTPVMFNDSELSGDTTGAPRSLDPSNVFQDTGGTDHEHPFSLMSNAAPYTKQGLGNFGFYFEAPPATGNGPEYSPYINFFDQDEGFAIGHVSGRDGSNIEGSVNSGNLDQQRFVGTSTYEVECEEDAATAGDGNAVCGETQTHQTGNAGFGSANGFGGQAGGNQNGNSGTTEQVDFEGYADRGESSQGFAIASDSFVSTHGIAPALIDTTIMRPRQQMVNFSLTGSDINLARVDYEEPIDFVGINPLESLGVPVVVEYVRNSTKAAEQLARLYPRTLSFASTFSFFDPEL